jgi:concanavalin A-like lectin/glucanase superfamily protein/Ig-like domain-containing protein
MKSPLYALAGMLVSTLWALTARADYSNTVMSLNPIAYYRLSETTPVPADTATNLGSAGAIGTALYLNTPTHQVSGALMGSTDTAVGFDGSSTTKDRVAAPFDSSINPTGQFTAEAWVYPAVVDSGTYCPLSYWTEAAGAVGRTGWLIYQNGTSGWTFRMYNGHTSSSTEVDLTGGGTPVANTWYHLAAVFDGTQASLYVNGLLVTQHVTTAYAPNIGGPFSIGARADGNFWWAGSADEPALYTNALSGADILAHYQNGTNTSPSQTYQSLVQSKNPLLYYRLDEPTFTPGSPVTTPNLGSLGSAADGTYEAGAFTGVAGPAFGGFGAGNKAMTISALAGDVVIDPQSVNTDVFTITGWFKRSGLHLGGQALVFNRHSDQSQATGLGFGYNGSPGVDELNVHWNEGPSSWLTGLIAPNDVWCFGAAVYTPSNVTVYLDNLSNSFNTTLTAHDFSLASTYIGWDFPFSRFSGSIDEVALFDRALSPTEVRTLFNSSQMPPQVLSISRTPADPLYEGYTITMTGTAGGATPMTNQWYKGTTLLTGKTNLTLTLANAATTDSGNYKLVVANAYGSATSAVQVITVSSGPPLFLSQSISDATRAVGGRVTYSVVAGGSSPISYQWKHGTTPIPGATTSVLKLTNLQLSDAGAYSVTLTNAYSPSPGTGTNSITGNVSVFAVTNYPFAAMYGNPLAYYRFSETSGTTAYDYAGGFNGTLTGPIVTGVTGPRPATWAGLESTNVGFQFDGTDTRVQLPPFNLQTNQMTIVAWINPAGPQNDQTGILNTRSSTGVAGFFVNRNGNNALSYVWEGTSSWNDFQSGLVPVENQWNFVALVIDPSKGTVYLDSGSGLTNASFFPSEGNKTVIWDSPNIGVDLGYPRWFNGDIDEVVVYDRALSSSEIANLDLLGTTTPGPKPEIIAQPSSATVYAGQSASFSVSAIGNLPLSYQWQHAGTNLPGATRSALVIPSAYYTDAGNYQAVITNSIGSSNSTIASLTVLAPPNFANLTNGLVLHLAFDGNYLDSSGHGNNATPVGSPTLIPGKLGQAMHYNTDNSIPASVIYNYATLGTPADLQFGTSQNFSVSYWIRFSGGSVDLPVLSNDNCGEGCIGFYFGPSAGGAGAPYLPGTWAWSFANSSYAGIDVEGPANAINDGQWHNLVTTLDRTGLGSTYLDGVQVDVRPISGFTDTLDTGNPVNVGQVGSADYNVVFGADVDDLGVWLRTLSPTEAESIYAVGQQGRSFDTVGPVVLSIRKAGTDLELVWQTGTLKSSTTGVLGTYNPVPDATAPYYRVTPGVTPTFYRVAP